MKKTGIIGYTGFVGSNLCTHSSYDLMFNSKNFQEMRGESFSQVVCAGVSAVKWKANKDPEADWAGIQPLLGTLREVNCDQFVLISTIDVYPVVQGLDEDFDCASQPNHAYGEHRLRVEAFCRERFENCLIVRLPALFGKNLKKNVIYDLLNDNCLEMINTESSFQYYDLSNLNRDIERALDAGLGLINLFTEPVKTGDILGRFFPDKSVGAKPAPEGHYDLRTKYGSLWGKPGEAYLYSKEDVLRAMGAFIESEREAMR